MGEVGHGEGVWYESMDSGRLTDIQLKVAVMSTNIPFMSDWGLKKLIILLGDAVVLVAGEEQVF